MPTSELNLIATLEEMINFKKSCTNSETWFEDFFKNKPYKMIDIQVAAAQRLSKMQLTAVAKSEAERFDITQTAYKNILLKVSNSQSALIIDDILTNFERSKITLEKLIEENNAAAIAARYEKLSNLSPVLCHINPGERYEDTDDEANVVVVLKKTTFVHEMLKASRSKDEIYAYMIFIYKTLGQNVELFNNYLDLTDEQGKSIRDILKSVNGKTGYQGLYDEVAKSCKLELKNTPSVDTHTRSIHYSADQSFVRLMRRFHASQIESLTDRTVKIVRDPKWESTIDSLLTELKVQITAKKRIFNAKEALQAKAALRLVDGLINGQTFGNKFLIEPNVEMINGFNLREIVALCYEVFKDTPHWRHQDHMDLCFKGMVENLYVAQRGYNIDDFGEDEIVTRHQDPDRNKCMAGIAHQAIQSVIDYDLVNLQVINEFTMAAPLKKALFPLLANTPNQQEVDSWFKTGIIPPLLVEYLVRELTQDRAFRKEFSEDEIKHYAEVILKTLDASIIQKEMQKYYPGKYSAASTEFKPTDIYKYVFNEEKGYELAVEKLFREDPTKFLVIVNNIIEIAFNRGQEATKAKVLLQLLLHSPNKVLVEKLETEINNFLSRANSKKVAIAMINCVEKELVTIVKILSKKQTILPVKDAAGNNLLYKAVMTGNKEIVEILLNAGKFDLASKNMSGQTALHAACFNGNQEIFALMLAISSKDNLNAPDNNAKTSIFYAVQGGNLEITKALLKHPEVDINHRDAKGNNLLYFAVKASNPDMLTKLLTKMHAGALKEKNASHISAFDLAKEINNPEIIQVINAYYNPNKMLREGVINKDEKLVKRAISLRGDVNFRDRNELSLLNIALENTQDYNDASSMAIVYSLLKKGADFTEAMLSKHSERLGLPQKKYIETSPSLLDEVEVLSCNLETVFTHHVSKIAKKLDKPEARLEIEKAAIGVMHCIGESNNPKVEKKVRKELLKAALEQKKANNSVIFGCCVDQGIEVTKHTNSIAAKIVEQRKSSRTFISEV